MEFKFNTSHDKTQFMNDIKTFNANFGDDHKVYESNKKSKHLDYFLEVKPSLFEGEGDVRTVVCLICAIEKKTFNLLKYSSTGCLTSHLNYHHKCNSSNEPLRTLLKDKVKEKFVNKKFMGIKKLVKRDPGKSKRFFKDYGPLKYMFAVWLMSSSRPSLLVEDTELRKIMKFLDLNVPLLSRSTEVRAEKAVYGFVFKSIKDRIAESAAFFDGAPFFSIQADAWTAQANYSVFGVSGSYYDVQSKRCETIILYAAPLTHGKKATELASILRAVIQQLDIDVSWISQVISDDEGAVRNGMKQAFPLAKSSVCMAHKIQTVLKHSFALAAKDYKKDSFPEAFNFFSRIRKLVAAFTASPNKTEKLKKLQIDDGVKIPLGMVKFSTTRWSAAFKVLCRLLRLKKYLDQFFLNEAFEKDLILQTVDWKKILQIAALLNNFSLITTFLQFKNRSINAAKHSFLSLLLNDIKEAKTSEIEFEGENKKLYSTKITLSLPKKMLKRLEKNFKAAFGKYLDVFTEGLDSVYYETFTEKEQLAAVYLDPRFRDYYFESKNDPFKVLMRNAARKTIVLVENEVNQEPRPTLMPGLIQTDSVPVRRSPRRAPVDDITTPTEAVNEATQRISKRFKVGERNYSNSPVHEDNFVDQRDILLKRYEKLNIMTQTNVFNSFIEKEDPLDPFKWWNEVLETHEELLPLAKSAFVLMSRQLASSFSEAQFTSAKTITSGTSARTGTKTLNARQFVKYNLQIVRKDFDDHLHEMESNSAFYTECISQLGDEFRNEVTRMHEEFFSIDDTADSESGSTASPKMCEKCHSFGMIIYEAKDFSNDIKCDYRGCERDGASFGRDEQFVGCSSCGEWDICLDCHKK